MEKMTFVGIIPARYASTRFPGKPLVKIGTKTMIQRVYEQAMKALDEVVVATDDTRIFDEVTGFGGKVLMTADTHPSGTDRCYEALTKLDKTYDVVINIQGDEPFISPDQINILKRCFTDSQVQIATLVKPVQAHASWEELSNTNRPKVVLNKQNDALYFSRSVIPHLRHVSPEEYASHAAFYTHIGMYAYRATTLKEIVSLAPTALELAESLEQLRWIESGYKIRVGFTESESISIDTPDDLHKIKNV